MSMVWSDVIQLIGLSRLGGKVRLDAIDQDIAIAYAKVGAKRKLHQAARHEKRTAELVHEKMVSLHVEQHLQSEQKELDEVASQRFASSLIAQARRVTRQREVAYPATGRQHLPSDIARGNATC